MPAGALHASQPGYPAAYWALGYCSSPHRTVSQGEPFSGGRGFQVFAVGDELGGVEHTQEKEMKADGVMVVLMSSCSYLVRVGDVSCVRQHKGAELIEVLHRPTSTAILKHRRGCLD